MVAFSPAFRFIPMKDRNVHFNRVYVTEIVAQSGIQTSQVSQTCEVLFRVRDCKGSVPIIHRYRSEAQP
jgi:hypothetical protein